MDRDIFETLLNRVVSLSIDLDHMRDARDAAERKASERRNEVAEVFNLILSLANDRKLEAIKAYRNLTGAGLKESKDAIETVTHRFLAS